MSTLLDVAVTRLVGLLMRVFFRQVEILGIEQLPRDRPLVLVANHTNSLVDPLLILGCLGLHPRFLAKSTLWRNPLLRPLFALAGVIPVYRRQDEGVDTSLNASTFSRCHELLARGGVVALFPEGLSHSEPSLQPMRTGAARIAREAEARFGPLGVRIVPVGLVFDDKGTFRSRVLIAIGTPLDPLAEHDLTTKDERAAVRQLTASIDEALTEVTLNYDSWDQARLIERAADLYARPSSELPTDSPMAESFSVRRAFIDGYAQLSKRIPEQVEGVAHEVREYDRLLELTGLSDTQLASLYPKKVVAAFAWRSIFRLGITFPIALVGSVLNWWPYWTCGMIADRWARLPDITATYKLFPALFFYPLAWCIEAILGWLIAGPVTAVAVLVLAPLSGWVAASFHQRRTRLTSETRAYLLLRSHRSLVERLHRHRQRLLEKISALATSVAEVESRE